MSSLKTSPVALTSLLGNGTKVKFVSNRTLQETSEKKEISIKRQAVSLETISSGKLKKVLPDMSFQDTERKKPVGKVKNSVSMYGISTSAVDEAVKLFKEVSREWG